MNIREANLEDMEILSIHHRKMFEEIWEHKGLGIDSNIAKILESAYLEKIAEQIPQGQCKAWIIYSDNEIMASGAITIVSFTPVPTDLNHNVAFLHSIYTEKAYRKKQCAKTIVERAIQYCRESGINRMLLNASDAGKQIYEKAGFVSVPETMRLFIK